MLQPSKSERRQALGHVSPRFKVTDLAHLGNCRADQGEKYLNSTERLVNFNVTIAGAAFWLGISSDLV